MPKVEATSGAGQLEEAWGIFDAKHLPYRVLMLGKMLDRLSSQHVRELSNLSLAEWRVLAHIAIMGPKSATEISAAALVDRAEVSRAVRSLEETGLLVRAENPKNRKSSLLKLSSSGHTIFERVHKQRRDFFDVLTEDMTQEELESLDALLLRMARRADKMARDQAARSS